MRTFVPITGDALQPWAPNQNPLGFLHSSVLPMGFMLAAHTSRSSLLVAHTHHFIVAPLGHSVPFRPSPFSPRRTQATMGSCHTLETLTVPVTLSESLGRDVQVINCPVVAAATLADLQTAITTFLGSHDVFESLSYRGFKAQLTSLLDSFASGGSNAPRCQASHAWVFLSCAWMYDGRKLGSDVGSFNAVILNSRSAQHRHPDAWQPLDAKHSTHTCVPRVA